MAQSKKKLAPTTAVLNVPDGPVTQIFTVPETAKILTCCISTVWRLIEKRELGHVKIARRVGVTRTQIEQYIAENSVQPINAQKLASGLWNS